MLRLITVVSLPVLVLVPRAAAACSPALRHDQYAEQAAFYAAIERPPYVVWGVSVVAALVWLLLISRRPRAGVWAWVFSAVLVALAAFQPAWWMESMTGDCGIARDSWALLVAALGIALVVIGRRWLPPTHRESREKWLRFSVQ